MDVDGHAHPRMNAALPMRDAGGELGAAGYRSRLGCASFHKYVAGVLRLETLWRGVMVSCQIVEEPDKSPTEFCHPCEGVKLAARILQTRTLPGGEINRNQTKFARGRIEQGTKVPSPSQAVPCDLLHEEVEVGPAVVAKQAGSWTHGFVKCGRIAGIEHSCCKWLRLRQC